MYVQTVTLASVRNYTRLTVEFASGLNLLYGDNAAGKTNLLEAVFYAASLRSFRGAKVRDILSWEGPDKGAGADGREEPTCRITATAAPISGGRSHTLTVTLGGDGRRISLDGKKPESVSEYLLTLKPSGFSPEDLFLAREYPSHRRRFVDRSAFHLEPGYIATANRYRQAVSQLNAALKSGDDKVVATYEELMAPLAAAVALKREGYLGRIQPLANDIFIRILGGAGGQKGPVEKPGPSGKPGPGGKPGWLGIEYRGGPPACGEAPDTNIDAATEHYAGKLRAKRAEGVRRGYVNIGPHTEDIVLTLGGRDIKTSASRGQGRLAYLAMVLADAALYKEQTGKHPVLLLDDVISELDETRTAALMDYVAGLGQAIITATDDRFMKGRDCRIFHVDGGEVARSGYKI